MFVIRRVGDDKFVAPPGREKSYTPDLTQARIFPTREAAEAERCVENEYILPLAACLQG